MGGSQLDCSSYDSIVLLAYLELPGTGAALYAAPSPYYLMYYFEQGCAASAAQPQLTLIALLTRKLSYSENSSMVVLTHHRFHEADSPQNIFSTASFNRNRKFLIGFKSGE
jgi:hypothetical protein